MDLPKVAPRKTSNALAICTTCCNVARTHLARGNVALLEILGSCSTARTDHPWDERQLVLQARHVAKQLPGTQQIREMMGHSLFGARVVHGDILFVTVSPSERHYGLVLRLGRCRRNDPMIQADLAIETMRRDMCGSDEPSISPNETATIDLPEYAARLKMNARDPHAVVSGFRVCIYVILPRCLGYRMCLLCPRCNVNGGAAPCQDQFGSNARPMGGSLGLCQAAGGAVEFQSSAHRTSMPTSICPLCINT